MAASRFDDLAPVEQRFILHGVRAERWARANCTLHLLPHRYATRGDWVLHWIGGGQLDRPRHSHHRSLDDVLEAAKRLSRRRRDGAMVTFRDGATMSPYAPDARVRLEESATAERAEAAQGRQFKKEVDTKRKEVKR